MISQSDEKLFEEISLMPTIEACKTIVKEFWEKGDNDRIIRLLELYKQKKHSCKSDEESFELSIALYDVYKSNGNLLAFRLAKQIIKEL